MKTLASYGLWLLIIVTCPLLFAGALLLWAVTAPFDRRLRALHLYACAWASLYTYVFPYWTVTVRHRERIRDGETYVLVANHQSLIDILVLFRLFVHFKWVSKIEMFRIPCIGWNMALNGYIKLRRGDSRSGAEMMRACERTLAEGSPIMMFPEGTRSPDGRLKAFKPGAFVLAQRARVPLLPIIVEGTSRALPKHGFVLRGRHAIRIRVLDEIAFASFAEKPIEQLAEEVHEIFAAALGERDSAALAPSAVAPRSRASGHGGHEGAAR